MTNLYKTAELSGVGLNDGLYMKYHAPTKQFTVSNTDLDYAAMCLRLAIKHIRLAAGLSLNKYKRETALTNADHAQKMIIDAAKAIGIDLGAEWGNELDVSDDV